VHERFTAADIAELRAAHPGIIVLAHPECPPDVMAAADYAGSTAALANYVIRNAPKKVVLLTECSMSDNVSAAVPSTEFIRPCNLCSHMKTITLAGIYDALKLHRHEVTVPEDIRERAKRAIDRMLALPKTSAPLDFKTGLPAAAVELFA
jgi:quinolinate synthase